MYTLEELQRLALCEDKYLEPLAKAVLALGVEDIELSDTLQCELEQSETENTDLKSKLLDLPDRVIMDVLKEPDEDINNSQEMVLITTARLRAIIYSLC